MVCGHKHSCQYRTIYDMYHIVYKKFCIVRAYCKCSWIVWYIGAYRMDRFLSLNHMYRTIHGHEGLKWVFFFLFKICCFIWFKQLVILFFNTKLLGYLNESNKITCPWIFFPSYFSYKICTIYLKLHFHICKFIFYADTAQIGNRR